MANKEDPNKWSREDDDILWDAYTKEVEKTRRGDGTPKLGPAIWSNIHQKCKLKLKNKTQYPQSGYCRYHGMGYFFAKMCNCGYFLLSFCV